MFVDEKELKSFCVNALISNGMDKNDAFDMANVLVLTDMWGVHTHGVKNLAKYIEKSKAGGVSFSNKPKIQTKEGSVAVVDGNNTMGYISATLAMNLACEIAANSGIAMVLVKNSCHFGAAGAYANIAAGKGMIGIVMSNVDKKMTIPGARGMVMGHNPFALAAPAIDFPSIILDISSSNVASLKVLKAKEKGERIPDTWITDKEGKPTTDPSRYPDEGALLPMGGHKGYGIAMFIEILTSILLGSYTSTGTEVNSWCFDMEKPNNVSHSVIVINPALFGESNQFIKRVNNFIDELHNMPKAEGSDRIFVPGEEMWERYALAKDIGIELSDDIVDELNRIDSNFYKKCLEANR